MERKEKLEMGKKTFKNTLAFLKAVPFLEGVSENCLQRLSKRLNVKVETLAILIHCSINGKNYHEN